MSSGIRPSRFGRLDTVAGVLAIRRFATVQFVGVEAFTSPPTP